MTAVQPSVVEALSRVMAAVQAVRKGDRNTQQGYSFRGIDAVVNAVGPALREHGVIVVPHVESAEYNVVEVGQKRTPMRECTVRVRYVFHGPAGDTLDCVSIGEAMDSGDKATPKAMSVAMRVALLQALCIPTDEPDADAQIYERAHERQQPPTREQIVARAREAIAAASDRETLDKLEVRLMQREHEGAITAEDAIALRRAWVARLDEIAPAGEAQAVERVADLPVTDKQHRRMHALWRQVGLGGEEHRDERLTRTSLIVGRDVDSSAHLTAIEADAVIDTLSAEVKARKAEVMA